MLAHLRVGTREEDIHQCCLLSKSNVFFSPLICSEASAKTGRKKKASRKHSWPNLFSSDRELVELRGCLLIHSATFRSA